MRLHIGNKPPLREIHLDKLMVGGRIHLFRHPIGFLKLFFINFKEPFLVTTFLL